MRLHLVDANGCSRHLLSSVFLRWFIAKAERFTENVRVPCERVPYDYLWLMRKKLSATIPAIKVNLERLGFTFN